ncbi:hypothetical protein E2C01_023322 [Portunus trituberculatus]|uniref:Uncharacterized protein n=1 Tax=Portunus trituberculatus TaxID=210409 RepID=A0A5B7E8I5_PORTR|nr:hypothetical protein [Portunus trituberculatus]
MALHARSDRFRRRDDVLSSIRERSESASLRKLRERHLARSPQPPGDQCDASVPSGSVLCSTGVVLESSRRS